MKELIKRALEVFGHALTVSVHKRLDHADHALDLIIDQNNRMARSQTALLQSSIHMVTTLNKLQSELNAIKRSVLRTAGRSDYLADAVDRSLGHLEQLKQAAGLQVEILGETAASRSGEDGARENPQGS